MESAAAAGDRRIVWAYRALVAGFLVLAAVPVFARPTGDWDGVYLGAAKNLRAGADLAAGGTSYVYPPFGALVAVPLTFLPRTAGLVAWALLNTLALLVILVGSWRLAGGRGLPGQPGTGRADHAAFWLGGMCAVGFLLDCAANWQTDLVIGAFIVAGCLLLSRGRGIAAGVTFGVAAAFKCTPLLFAPYLLWKRRFLAATAVPLVAVGLNLLPDLAYSPTDGKPRLALWKERFLDSMGQKDRDPGLWFSAVEYNHSLAGVVLRWAAFDRAGVNVWPLAVPKADRPAAADLRKLDLALYALLGLVALVAFWRRPADLTPGPVLAAELGAVVALMLIFSPMSSKPHFGILLLPQLALVRAGWVHRDRPLLALAAVLAVAGLCTGKDVVGRAAYELLLWNGLVFWMTLALFLGCCHARFRYTSRAEPAATAAPQPAADRRAA